jgi:hypothetical protein
MSKYILAFLLLIVCQAAYGQKQIAQHYTMANGLPSNEVFSVIKDKRGYMWFATDGGVCRFDGQTFKKFTTKEGLSENTILEIKEDKYSRIWCRGYSGSFTVIDRDSLYAIDIKAELTRHSIESTLYQFEVDDSLNLYLASRISSLVFISRYPYHKLEPLSLPGSAITFFQINKRQHITSYRMNPNETRTDEKVTMVQAGTTRQVPIDLYGTKFNYFLRYIYTPKYLGVSIDEKLVMMSTTTCEQKTLILPFRISAMALVSDNTFMLGGFQGQVGILNSETGKFRLLDNYPSAISNIRYADNTCWLTTLKNGVYFIANTNYVVVHENAEPLISLLPISNDSIYVLNSNSEIALIASDKAVAFPNNNRQKTLMYWQQFDKSQNRYIPFVGSYNYLIDRSTNRKQYFNLTSDINLKLTEFVVPMGDSIYTSFFGGVRVYDKKSGQSSRFIRATVRSTCMFGHEGVLYLGSLQGAYKLQDGAILPLDTHAYFKHRVESIDKISKDLLLIATQAHGIGVYNLRTRQLTAYNKNVNLDKLIIQHAHVDDQGKIWIATYQSVHVLKLGPDLSCELVEVVDLELYDHAIKEVRTLNNNVYVLAGNLVLKIPEKDIKFNTQPFNIILNALIINGKTINYKDSALIDLSPNKNNLLFKYQLLSYTQSKQIDYRYRLNDDEWIYTSNNQLQLASLPSGRYELNIQGRIKDGRWSSSIVVNFNIKVAFYKTWWFKLALIIGCLVVSFLLIAGYLKRKFKKRLKEFELQRELESARLMASKSQMNPHFIFNALNSIQSFVLKSEKMQAYQYLNDFSALIRTYLEYSNRDYIRLDKELELIQAYIKIEQLRIPFQFDLQVADNVIPHEDCIFSLLLQPCLENAIWHGLNHKVGVKQLSITINKHNNRIAIYITDNGVGRQQSAIINANRISKPNSVATNNMFSRINSLNLLHKNNITLQIIDNYDTQGLATGTTVLISHNDIKTFEQT